MMKRGVYIINTARGGLRYGLDELKLRGFSWKHGINSFAKQASLVPSLEVDPPDLPKGSFYTLHRDIQHPACLTFSVPPSHSSTVPEY